MFHKILIFLNIFCEIIFNILNKIFKALININKRTANIKSLIFNKN